MKLKKGSVYYLVLHKRDWTYKPAVLVPVRIIRQHREGKYSSCEWYDVEQVDCKNKLIVHEEWMAPNLEKAKNLLFNMKQWEHRWNANSWRFNLRWDAVRDEVLSKLFTLSKKKQEEIWKAAQAVYGDYFDPEGKPLIKKFTMKIWDEFAWAYIANKYPLKEVWKNKSQKVKDGE